jgi:hypothetical protein
MTGQHDSPLCLPVPQRLDPHRPGSIAEALSTMVSHDLNEPGLPPDSQFRVHHAWTQFRDSHADWLRRWPQLDPFDCLTEALIARWVQPRLGRPSPGTAYRIGASFPIGADLRSAPGRTNTSRAAAPESSASADPDFGQC